MTNWGKKSKEEIVAQIQLPSWHFPGGNEQNYEKPVRVASLQADTNVVLLNTERSANCVIAVSTYVMYKHTE
jgi:hypothetical protein